MAVSSLRKHVWWGSFSLPEGQSGRWRIGSAIFTISRLRNEWTVAYETVEEAAEEAEDSVEVALPLAQPEEPGPKAKVTRFGMSKTDKTLKLIPALADRSVVIRTEKPLHVLSNQEVKLYVNSPLWVRIETGDPQIVLQDIPILRPSDTWFGASTVQGELCYASRIYGRLSLEDIRFRPHRAVTPVLLRNLGKDSLFLERLNLPVHNLSLYESEENYLWTQSIALEAGTDDKADLELKKGAPKEAKNPKLICGPREKAEKKILSRALKSLIS
jgi:hypothetical protein